MTRFLPQLSTCGLNNPARHPPPPPRMTRTTTTSVVESSASTIPIAFGYLQGKQSSFVFARRTAQRLCFTSKFTEDSLTPLEGSRLVGVGGPLINERAEKSAHDEHMKKQTECALKRETKPATF